jgi:hypothetical protein
MKKCFPFMLLAILVGGLFATDALSAKSPTFSIAQEESAAVEGLSVVQVSPTSVRASWAGSDGDGNYTVKVKNLATGQTVQTHSTANTSILIAGLVNGQQYRISVEKEGIIIGSADVPME